MGRREQPERKRVERLHADPQYGLSEQQVRERTEALWTGGNKSVPGRSEKEIVISHSLTFFNLIFVFLALLLAAAESPVENMGFLAVAAINTVIGIVQELRAKRAVDSLALLSRRQVTVIRDGRSCKISPEAVVRDDIAVFCQGDQICGDGILRSGEIWVDESQLTGETDAAHKQVGESVYAGSFLLAGTGRVELTAVGADCSAAAVAAMAKANPAARKSEMMRSLDGLILFVGIALVPIGAVLFYQEFRVLDLGFRKSIEGTVAALVGMIPEGLYLLTGIALAVSAGKLSKSRVLVQDQNCIETLARVDVLCVDKTGTITEPELDVADVIPLPGKSPELLGQVLTAMYAGTVPENATARAVAAHFCGESDWECRKRIPFSSRTKWSAASFLGKGWYLLGAPETILGPQMEEYAPQVTVWAEQGYRVLLAAEYDGMPEQDTIQPERVQPLGWIRMTGRVRPNARKTFAYFMEQGVSVCVISGDNPATAARIARMAGIPGKYMDASVLKTDRDFREAVQNYRIFGRATPEQKRRLVAALQSDGHTVAMTGDGVNDLLAMKQADCSVAMASGTQAASGLASLVLTDSDFSAMPGIVAEGRRVINNIQRAATLYLVKNIFSLFLSVITLFTSWPYPLKPIQLTVISALTIGAPSFLLTMEPRYDRIQGHFLRGVLRRAFPGGLTNVFAVLLCQAFMATFALSTASVSAVCAGILAVVGLLVLYQVCKPFDRFRRFLWTGMAMGLLTAFAVLRDVFSLDALTAETRLVMFALLIMTPAVFFAAEWIFDFGEKRLLFLREKRFGKKVS